MNKLLLGDCLERMKEIPDNSVDSIVTDPPYGLSFMGKKWDYNVPSTDIWTEALRVLKPGGHLLSFGGTRTYHRLVVAIEDSGFEIRDQIMWIYGSGFPKSHNLKEQWQGWGTALKPANEPVVVARKPLEKDLTVAHNVLKWGTGALNIDGSRIGTELVESGRAGRKHQEITIGNPGILMATDKSYSQGRWPANIIFDEEAAKALDEQTGELKGGGYPAEGTDRSHVSTFGKPNKRGKQEFKASSGFASRFFYVAKASKAERNAGCEGLPLVRIEGQPSFLDEGGIGKSSGKPNKPIHNRNFHPTVKPLKLGTYLQNLVTPPGGVTLDPFMGSGTFGVSAKAAGFKFIGIERDEAYFEIASKRINNA